MCALPSKTIEEQFSNKHFARYALKNKNGIMWRAAARATTSKDGPPKQTGWRSKVLALICCLTLGVYYAYDLPAALPDNFFMLSGGSATKYELLYSAYSLPNIVTPVFMGYVSSARPCMH